MTKTIVIPNKALFVFYLLVKTSRFLLFFYIFKAICISFQRTEKVHIFKKYIFSIVWQINFFFFLLQDIQHLKMFQVGALEYFSGFECLCDINLKHHNNSSVYCVVCDDFLRWRSNSVDVGNLLHKNLPPPWFCVGNSGLYLIMSTVEQLLESFWNVLVLLASPSHLPFHF